ncbi:MAG: GNAT family N-acetyltransferase [Myxococcota bacterium]
MAGFSDLETERRIHAWLNAGLRPRRPGRLQREYPFLFGPESSAVPITLYLGRRPAAFCILWPSNFRLGQGSLRVGLISLVYTAPEFRGQGYASSVIEAAISEANRLGLGCVALWSDLDAFYTRLGFRPAGAETLLQLDRPLLDRALSIHARSSPELLETDVPRSPSAADWERIETLRAQRRCNHPLRLLPGPMGGIPDMQVRVAGESSAAPDFGFAMRGRGDDFPGFIHEWGGDTGGALQCLRALTGNDPLTQSTLLLAADADAELVESLLAAGASSATQPLAWFRFADVEAFSAEISRCIGQHFTLRRVNTDNPLDHEKELSLRSAHAEIRLPTQTVLNGFLGSALELTRQDSAAELLPLFRRDTPPSLPLPFFISGLESI